MISVFNGNSGKDGGRDLRDAYLARLQEICQTDDHASIWSVSEDASISVPNPIPLVKEPPKRIEEMSDKQPNKMVDREQASSSGEFENIAERIAPKFTEALMDAMKVAHRLALGDGSNLEVVITEVARMSEDLGFVGGELTNLRHQSERFVQEEQKLSAALANLENRLHEREETDQAIADNFQKLRDNQEQDLKTQSEVLSRLAEGLNSMTAGLSQVSERIEAVTRALQVQTEATSELKSISCRLQGSQHELERRLDNQAEAIRTLYSTRQAQDGRWGMFQSVVEQLKQIAVEPAPPTPLPETL
jgi:chromosome segregation ATPase